MFEKIKFFISGFKQSYQNSVRKIMHIGIVSIISLSICLCSCGSKPTTSDMQNIHTVKLHVKQNFTNVEEDIALPLTDMLSELFEKINVKVVSENEFSDAVLTINLKGRPRKATFTEPKRIFYEAAFVNGTASLAMKGFSSKKVKLYGAKHYYSTNYYPYSNSDPKKPLIYASRRAFSKMLIDLWGPSVLLSITIGVNHELDEIIKEKDAPGVVPVLFQALQSDNPSVRQSAVLMLDEFTRTKEYNVKGRRESKIVAMSSDMRNAVLKDLNQLVKAVENDNNKVSIKAMDILSRFGQEATVAIPVLKEALMRDDKEIQGVALRTLGNIAQPQESVPILIDALQSKSNDVRRPVLIALGKIGSEAKEALPYIIQILEDEKESSNMRDNAARALKGFGSEARAAVPALIQALKSDAPFLPHSSNKALEVITGQKFGLSVQKWQDWWETQ
jgi:HEAT repeat protein